MPSTPLPTVIPALAAALAIGLLIGLQRGWSARDRSEGSRVAGLRTFALIGLMGGVLASLPAGLGPWPLAAGLLGLGVLMAVSYRESVRVDGNLSVTTSVAALLTAALGAFAASGFEVTALAVAVVVAVLLDYKSTLHRWLQLVEQVELRAALQVLVLSVVVLPLLPDRGFGPNEALNPYKLWWAVVLLASLSLAGHVAMRLSGPQRGLLWTGVLGGLASSTATTLALARQVRRNEKLLVPAAAAAMAACGIMFVRMLAVVAALQPAMARTVAAPLLASGAVLLAAAVWQWRRRDRSAVEAADHEASPFDLGTVLGFGALLAVVGLLVEIGKQWFGAAGVYGVAALSGLVDVDAIVVSVARMPVVNEQAGATMPALALGLAALTNMVSKGAMAWGVGGKAFGWRMAGAFAACSVAGAVAMLG